jgi:endoglucanase
MRTVSARFKKLYLLWILLLLLTGTSKTDVTGVSTKVGDPLPSTGMIQEAPRISHISAVAPNVLCIEIDACRILPIIQIPYIADPADKITIRGETLLGEPQDMFVERNGFPLGSLVGPDRKTLVLHERLAGKHLDAEVADQVTSYRIESASDVKYKQALAPLSVSRKSKPTGFTDTSYKLTQEQSYSAKHYVYLNLPHALKTGHAYRINLPALNLKQSACYYVHDPAHVRSEAVHVSQIGFRADDPDKNAFLSIWIGTGGGYTFSEIPGFSLIDDKANETVYTGIGVLQWKGSEPEGVGSKINHSRTDVIRLDFSQFNKAGRYRIQVDGIGCSYPFYIDEKHTWKHAFQISMKGHFNHRSGLPMLPPFTDFVRPRSFHPADGVKVYQSTCSLLNSGNGLNAMGTDRGNFPNLVNGKTDELVAEAWGGTMDAGDWDRRINHLFTPRHYLELVELYPDYFKNMCLNIPESGNDLPDVVDEALFGLDIYRRMQMPDGGIRGGVESSEHPVEGSTSWQEPLTVLAYAPDHWSSYIYAGVAARAAFVLNMLEHKDLAQIWSESAVKAMEWAEVEYEKWKASTDYVNVRDRAKRAVPTERNLAAVELYRLTRDKRWHQVYLSTLDVESNRSEAGFVYARLDPSLVDTSIQQQVIQALLAEADEVIRLAQQGAYGITTSQSGRALGGYASTFTIPAEPLLVRAHVLSGDEKYLKAILRSTLYSAGANPTNLCFTTGLGDYYVQNVLHEDSKHTGQPAPIGITVFGPSELSANARPGSEIEIRLKGTTTPSLSEWPTYESYFDVFWFISQNEYVIDRPLGQAAYIWGYLAARD